MKNFQGSNNYVLLVIAVLLNTAILPAQSICTGGDACTKT